jgi:hypothetical protein
MKDIKESTFYISIIVWLLLILSLAFVSADNHRRETYNYTGSYDGYSREKVNYSLFDAERFTGVRADFSENVSAESFLGDGSYLTGISTANFSNFSDNWITNIGNLDDVNDTEFDNVGGILTHSISWLTGVFNSLISIAEPLLNVNSSNFWDSIDEPNSTFFDVINSQLTINPEWFQSAWNSELDMTTTDQLTEGSINKYDNKSFNQTFTDEKYVNIDGDTMTGILDMGNNNLTNVDNLTVNQNIIADTLFALNDVEIDDRLYVGFDSDECDAVTPGGICVRGTSSFNSSVGIFSSPIGLAFSVLNSFEQSEVEDFFNFSGTFDVDNNIFCDPTNFFDEEDLGDGFGVVFSIPSFFGYVFEIREIINSTCVLAIPVGLGVTTVDNFNTASYIKVNSPILYITNGDEGGGVKFNIGKNEGDTFLIDILNSTRTDNIITRLIAGVNNVITSVINTDANGFTGLINFISRMESTSQVNGSVTTNTILQADLGNHIGGEYTGLDVSLVDPGTNVTKTGIKISSLFDSLITVGQNEDVEKSFYDDTSTVTNITNKINDSSVGTELWQDDQSIVYIGNSINFTEITFSLSVNPSVSIDPLYFYCNNTGGYELLIVTDTTNGFSNSGTISFISPSDRGTCNTQIDGTPFSGGESFTYIAIQRNESFILTPPTINLIQLFLKSIELKVGKDITIGEDGGFIIENTDQERAGGLVYGVSGFVEGIKEHFFGIQTGLNDSATFVRNSFCVMSSRNVSILNRNNWTYLFNCEQRVKDMGIAVKQDFDSMGVGASGFFEFDLGTQKMYLYNDLGNGGLDGAGTFDFSLSGNDANFINGSIHSLIPVTFEQGFNEGDTVNIAQESFPGSLGIFTNDPGNILDWFVSANALCDDGQCAIAQGNGGAVIMETSFSTTDTNITAVHFVYSLTNLIGLDTFNVFANNNIGSGDVLIFTDAGTDILVPVSIDLDPEFWDAAQVNITVECDASGVTRFCYFDTFKVNGTATTTTNVNVSGFDSEICFGEGIRDSAGMCNNGIYYNASQNKIFTNGDWNLTGGGGEGTTSHPALTNLEWASAGHTFASADQTMDIGSYDLTTTGNITAESYLGDGQYLTGITVSIANQSDFWNDYDDFNQTQTDQVGNILTISISWLTGVLDSWFSGKDTDDLTEGSTNKYNNDSFNQIFTNTLYPQLGDTDYLNNLSQNPFDQILNTTSDVQFNNITSIDCITFDSGGQICSGS